MSKDRMDPFKLVELRAQYRVLSEIEEMFPKNSTHRAAKYAVKRMCEILKEIEAVTNNTLIYNDFHIHDSEELEKITETPKNKKWWWF